MFTAMISAIVNKYAVPYEMAICLLEWEGIRRAYATAWPRLDEALRGYGIAPEEFHAVVAEYEKEGENKHEKEGKDD